jgi:NAD(P)-dependent dehydrogenase (short-subunit alcohol dehydrogenase family)
VNNAGIGQTMAPAEWLPLETYVNVFNVNCLGCVDVVKTFLPLLGRSGGRIVNVTSANGRNAMCMMSAYAISKFGVEAFSDSIRWAIGL